jgi:hypothetical protein
MVDSAPERIQWKDDCTLRHADANADAVRPRRALPLDGCTLSGTSAPPVVRTATHSVRCTWRRDRCKTRGVRSQRQGRTPRAEGPPGGTRLKLQTNPA